MLRILLISLVISNLLLLAFQSDKPDVPPRTTATRPEIKDTGIPTIHLFSEMMEDQGLMSSNRQCFTLGPFHSSEDKDDVRTRLLEVTTQISERQTEALVEKGYWVFMPPYASPLEANKALFSLQALGLEDVAIMYDGDRKNAISLGYFLRQENAQRRKKDLEDRGFAAEMRIQRQAEPRYWLDYEQIPGSGLVALDMQNRPNDFMQRPVPCPEQNLAEDAGGALHTSEQDSLAVAEVVSQAPEQKVSNDTEVAKVVSQPQEKSKSEDTSAAVTAPGKDKTVVTKATSQPTEKAMPEDTGTVANATGKEETEVAKAAPQPAKKATSEDTGTVAKATGKEETEVTKAAPQPAEKATPADTGTAVTDSGQDKSEDTKAASQPPEEAGPDAAGAVIEASEQNPPENISPVKPNVEQAIQEATGGVSENPEQGDDEVTGADSQDTDQVEPDDNNVTSQAPAEYLPRPQASREDNGTDPGQADNSDMEKAIDGAPAQSSEAPPDQAVDSQAENGGKDGTVEG